MLLKRYIKHKQKVLRFFQEKNIIDKHMLNKSALLKCSAWEGPGPGIISLFYFSLI